MDNAQSPPRTSIVFLQVILVLIGIGVLTFMLWEPQLEGRNAHATLIEIYFKDPFRAYVYLGSIAFFVALSRAFRLLGYVGQNRAFSLDSVRAVRTIKHCAIVLVVMIGGALAYILIFQRRKDDIAGGVAMSLFLMLISGVIGTTAAVLERVLHAELRGRIGGET